MALKLMRVAEKGIVVWTGLKTQERDKEWMQSSREEAVRDNQCSVWLLGKFQHQKD